MPLPDKTDAVLLPPGYLNDLENYQRYLAIDLRFRDTLGLKPGEGRVWMTECLARSATIEPGSLFLHAAPHELLMFPVAHRLASQSRYDWSEPTADGVRFGTLRPEATEE